MAQDVCFTEACAPVIILISELFCLLLALDHGEKREDLCRIHFACADVMGSATTTQNNSLCLADTTQA